MKRLLILLLAAALLLAAGCSGEKTDASPFGLGGAAGAGTETAAPTQAGTVPTTEGPAPTTLPETTAELPPAQPTTQPPETTAAPVVTTEPEPEPTTEAPTEPLDPWSLMKETFFGQGSFVDEYEDEYSYSYAIPGIDADTPGAQEINAAIDESFGAWVGEAYAAMDEGRGPELLQVGYHGEVWEDVLSLVIVCRSIWEGDYYGIYCYEVSTGRWLSTAQVLERMDVSQEEFLEICRRQFRQYYVDMYSEIPEDQRETYGYYWGLDRVDSDEYVNMDLQVYPVASGDLVVIAPIVSLAGADSYFHPIHLGLGGVG